MKKTKAETGFSVTKSREGLRLGYMETPHGGLETPVFMPVGTQGSVKTFTPMELEELGSKIILGNTYHLVVRPGLDVIEKMGGLHQFISWPGAILTDSGGYQVFSLAKLRKVTEEGAVFNSHFDGRQIFFTPENVVEMQEKFGSDIMMPLDECPPYIDDRSVVKKAMERTLVWARRSRKARRDFRLALFGIIQGGHFDELRNESLERTVEMEFDGYALGGLSVGEPAPLMYEMVEKFAPRMPWDQPRYLMGVGMPIDILRAVACGIDMFDCVIPTRYGRNGSAITRGGLLVVRNGLYSEDPKPLDERCSCKVCLRFSRAYIRHLLNAEEILGPRLVSYHNLHFFLNLLADIRQHIQAGTFTQFHKDFSSGYDAAQR
ncbi:MAG: tRNA guanosine(34) transglycosylase Tgt [Candidatus Omnitrophica bacterium]|nr:tRNA guanosine(34) transglycosylase Tgt [Candidatus Omnitrophota bacterium]